MNQKINPKNPPPARGNCCMKIQNPSFSLSVSIYFFLISIHSSWGFFQWQFGRSPSTFFIKSQKGYPLEFIVVVAAAVFFLAAIEFLFYLDLREDLGFKCFRLVEFWLWRILKWFRDLSWLVKTTYKRPCKFLISNISFGHP